MDARSSWSLVLEDGLLGNKQDSVCVAEAALPFTAEYAQNT